MEIRLSVGEARTRRPGFAGLPPDLEAAVRAFAGGDAARAKRRPGFSRAAVGTSDPSAARGLAALSRIRPRPRRLQPAPEGPRGIADQILAALRSPGAPLRAAAQGAIEGALQWLGDDARSSPRCSMAANESPEAAVRAAAPLKALPGMRDALGLLDTGRVLSDGRANGDAASRGEGVAYFVAPRDRLREGGFGRVEIGGGWRSDRRGRRASWATLELTRLGLLQIVLALAAGAAAVTGSASPASRRLLERDRRVCLKPCTGWGSAPTCASGPPDLEPILPRSRGGLDVRA